MKNIKKKNIIIALIIGAVYPYIFSLLCSIFLPGRNEVPTLANPLGVVGFFGAYIFSIPILSTVTGFMIVVNFAHENGFVIPLVDRLAPEAQITAGLILGYIINVLVWLFVVSYFQQIRKKREVSPES
jgi:hypothetical protein